MKRVILYPYHMRCSGPREIVKQLKARGITAFRVYPDRNYRPKQDDLIVNWGSSRKPEWLEFAPTPVNYYGYIWNSVNKILSFMHFDEAGVNTPLHTGNGDLVKEWLRNGKEVVARQTITGHGGKGIVVMTKPEDFIVAPLYTQYKPKKKEFRIHVFDGKVIDFQQKKKRNGVEANSKIRSYGNGWVFARDGVVLPDDAAEQAVKAVASLGLDFGGVDLIWNEFENKSYVLEVNSAPGIEGTTVNKYTEAIIERLRKA